MAPEMAIQGRQARSQSISSDRPSLTGYGGLLSPPLSVSPDPAFIAASAASQIVTNDHDSQPESWLDQHGIEPSGETALVAQPALRLVNRFLDQLLFNFLSVSKSTSLASLRPAVSEVLKPKLAKDAISGADQELHEYLGGGEDDDMMALHNGLETPGDWDLELVWKRTRLRCMVYSSLGDMEEEDEDFYTEQDHLDSSAASNGQAGALGVVSPAVAIFLTSILEFIGEQVLVVAGRASYQRLRAKLEKEARDGTTTPADIAERVVVDDSDMERVALDRTLGRLWRGWKKRIRSPTTSISMARSFSRESFGSQPFSSRPASISPDENEVEEDRRPSLAAVLAEYEYAAGIPLPMSADDIREIEIPGLALQSDDEEEAPSSDEELHLPTRPKSMIFYNHVRKDPSTPISSSALVTPARASRKRSNSMPLPPVLPYSSPKRQKALADDSTELVQEPEELEACVDGGEQVEETDDNVKAHGGIIASAITGTLALGVAAVAGVTALAHGEAPQTDFDSKSEIDPEEFTEEAQIMTSSRVSIGGRISPDDLKATSGAGSRRSSIRSHSVHSLRVIDVASSKSPTISRTGSGSSEHFIRPVAGSRSNSIHSPLADSQIPRGHSPISRSPNNSPHIRSRPSRTGTPIRNSNGDSIMEVEEKEAYESEGELLTAVPAELAAAMQGVDVEASPTSQQYGPGEHLAEPRAQPAPFVLAAAPPPKSRLRDTDGARDMGHSNGRLGVSKAPGPEYGVPPLTPLRELMEGAPDTSDEASSMTASNDNYSDSTRTVRQNGNALRSSPPRSKRDDSKANRSIHTSDSTSTVSSQRLVAKRASEDDSPTGSKGSKSQSFEQLIRSDQTIQYTLTPENMRNIEAPESPSTTANTHEVPRPPTTRSRSSSTNKVNGLRANPPTDVPKSTARSYTPISRPPTNMSNGSRLRTNQPQARDARVDRDSIGDFADFIRSTGPANSYESGPPRSVQSHRGTNGSARNVSGTVPRVASPAAVPRRAASSAGRKKLQARDAVVSRGDSISDLIDFVRSGPQMERENHRIPRTVAPFRTTMDSDQMSGAVGGKAIDASIPDARYSAASNSVTSSVTSQTALLKNASFNKPLPHQDVTEFDEEDMMPKRKTRRVRDQYAIDFSDEEEEIQVATRRKPPPQEESLADFLRNVPPPPEPTTSSVFDSVPKPPGKDVRKKSSTNGLMSRFGRSGSSPQVSQKPPKSSGQESRSSSIRNGPLPHRPITAKYTPAAASTTWDASHNNNYASQADSARNKIPRKAYQPRDAVLSNTSRTNDLADFLMRSEPPSSTQAQPQPFAPTLQKEEASAFQRMFGRKKIH